MISRQNQFFTKFTRCFTSSISPPVPVQNVIDKLYLRKHSKDPQPLIVAALTGGGGAFFQHALSTPGASSCILEMNVPYHKEACLSWMNMSGRPQSGGFCSGEMARGLSEGSRMRAMEICRELKDLPRVVGVGTTATIVSHYKRRGGYRIHTAVSLPTGYTSVSSHALVKGARERDQEDELCAIVTWRKIAKVLKLKDTGIDGFKILDTETSSLNLTNAVGERAEGSEEKPVDRNYIEGNDDGSEIFVWDGHSREVVALSAPRRLYKDTVVFLSYDEGRNVDDLDRLRRKVLELVGSEGDGKGGSWGVRPGPALYFGKRDPKSTREFVKRKMPWDEQRNAGGLTLGKKFEDDGIMEVIEKYSNDANFVISEPDLHELLKSKSNCDRLITCFNKETRVIVLDDHYSQTKDHKVYHHEIPKIIRSNFSYLPKIIQYSGDLEDFDDGSPSTKSARCFYDGSWDEINNCPHGEGVATWENGIVYEGNFRKGKYHGKGFKRYSKGGGYQGEWIKGRRSGKGTSYFDGKFGYDKWEGFFKKDKPDGHGIMFDMEGGQIDFEFRKGIPVKNI